MRINRQTYLLRKHHRQQCVIGDSPRDESMKPGRKRLDEATLGVAKAGCGVRRAYARAFCAMRQNEALAGTMHSLPILHASLILLSNTYGVHGLKCNRGR